MLKNIRIKILFLLFFLLTPISFSYAEVTAKVEVGNGIFVTKKTYQAPVNEQPFFGFAEKTKEQNQIDEVFLQKIGQTESMKNKALHQVMQRGWEAINNHDFSTAAKRFNQAHLIYPGHSEVFHGFAVITHLRFDDIEYAEELFDTGSHLEGRSPGYMADYGRFLMVINKPDKALPVLEEAVKDTPDNVTAWSNLAFARGMNGFTEEACAAMKTSSNLNPSTLIKEDLETFYQNVKCRE